MPDEEEKKLESSPLNSETQDIVEYEQEGENRGGLDIGPLAGEAQELEGQGPQDESEHAGQDVLQPMFPHPVLCRNYPCI